METISTTDLIKNTAEALDPVATHGRPTLVQRHGKDIAVLVSPQDFQLLNQVRLALATVAANAATPAPDKPESVSQEASEAPDPACLRAATIEDFLLQHPELRQVYNTMRSIISGESADHDNYTLVSTKSARDFGCTIFKNVYLHNHTMKFVSITARYTPANAVQTQTLCEHPWYVTEWGEVTPNFAYASATDTAADPKPTLITHWQPRHPSEL